MLDSLKRLIMTGLDTQARVIDFLDELVQKGKIDEAERTKFVEELEEKIGHSKEKGEELINELVSRISDKNPFVCKNDIEAIDTRIEELTKRVTKLEQKKRKKT